MMSREPVPQLVEPDWLEARLGAPDLRVVDCTAHLHFDPETGERTTESGRANWAESHIPTSVFADVPGALSAPDPAYPYQRPSAARFVDAMDALGIGDDDRVVLYDAVGNGWAARLWWLLRAFGFDRAGILDGGWKRWVDEGRPVSSDSSVSPADRDGTFTPNPRPGLFVDREEVRAAIDDGSCCLVNALRPSDHEGAGTVKYGRPGRIPDSVNVPAVGENAFVRSDGTYLPRAEIRRRFADAGVLDCERVITYCGGGIAASNAAFALSLMGVSNVAVYDGSLAEWGRTDLPMETG